MFGRKTRKLGDGSDLHTTLRAFELDYAAIARSAMTSMLPAPGTHFSAEEAEERYWLTVLRGAARLCKTSLQAIVRVDQTGFQSWSSGDVPSSVRTLIIESCRIGNFEVGDVRLLQVSQNSLTLGKLLDSGIKEVVLGCIRDASGSKVILVLGSGTRSGISAEVLNGIRSLIGELKKDEENHLRILALFGRFDELASQKFSQQKQILGLAHDLRSPGQSIKAAMTAWQLTYPDVSGPQGELKAAILSSTDHLLDMADQIAEVVGGRVSKRSETTEVVQSVREILDRSRPTAESLDVEVVEVLGRGEHWCKARKIDLTRVLGNLVDNAIRHARGGVVRVELRVEDGCININIVNRASSFSENTDTTVSEVGWGIGLKVTQDLATKIGAEVQVTQIANKAVLAKFSIPACAPEKPMPVQSNQTASELVLIVDDDLECGRSLSRLLESYGFATRCVSSIDEAMSSLAETVVKWVLTDRDMPGGGSQELLKHVKADGHSQPVAIISGGGNDEELYALAAAGAQGYFKKPVDIESLVTWLRAKSHGNEYIRSRNAA